MAAISPLFLFGIPRSGTTLLQRMLSTHPAVATFSEPWLLFPGIYALRDCGVVSEYGHSIMAAATRDVVSALADGKMAYYRHLREHIIGLYEELSQSKPNARYFLDKTPRYALIADDILELFPDAKYVFLWRNPLAVAASMIEVWGRGQWRASRFTQDLVRGLKNLVAAFHNAGDRAIAVRYEDLVCEPSAHLGRVFEYLDLSGSETAVAAFSDVEMGGHMGDPTGRRRYRTLSTQPLSKWNAALHNPLRRWWCRRYLEELGPAVLRTMGYDLDQLRQQIDVLPWSNRNTARDAFWLASDLLAEKVKEAALSGKLHVKRRKPRYLRG